MSDVMTTSDPATPILDGQQSRPLAVVVAILALFGVGLVSALIVPATTGGDYNHLVPDATLSEAGQDGLDVYLNEGCWYCHTQLVRPVVADVGLGPATETFADSLDTAAFGIQRIGPDLAHVGSRDRSSSMLKSLLTDPQSASPDGIHPSYRYLSDSDLSALVTYLTELK